MALDCVWSAARQMLITAAAALAWSAVITTSGLARGDDSEQQRIARLQKMSPDEKEDLLAKQRRFEGLTKEEQDRLRELHDSITGDARAKELAEAAKRYNQWLASLSSLERADLLDIKDPNERIKKIKELMQRQEDHRFRQFLPALPSEDREVINKWLEEFVLRHEEEIRRQPPPSPRGKLSESPDEEARRRSLRDLIGRWGWRYRRREEGNPVPTAEEFDQLVKSLSTETQSKINQAANRDQRQKYVDELVGAVILNRFSPPVSQEELLKFYASLKPDDPRRARLEGLEGAVLQRELLWMFNQQRVGERGPGFGFGSQRGPFGPPSERGGRGGGPSGRGNGPPGGRGDGRGADSAPMTGASPATPTRP